jgi:hypothetical protein
LRRSLCGLLIPARLDEDVDHVAVLVDCTPQILQLAVDPKKDFVEIPSVAGSGAAQPNPLGIGATKFQAPLPAGLITDPNATLAIISSTSR